MHILKYNKQRYVIDATIRYDFEIIFFLQIISRAFMLFSNFIKNRDGYDNCYIFGG